MKSFLGKFFIFLALVSFPTLGFPQNKGNLPKKQEKKVIQGQDKKNTEDKEDKKEPVKKEDSKPSLRQDSKIQVWIESQPLQAEVYSQGKLLGVTPAKFQIPVGNYTLYLFKKGYIIKVLEGKAEKGKNLHFKIKLIQDIQVPHGINLKYAPHYISDANQSLSLFQRALIYLTHFHVSAPKEGDLVQGAIETMVKALNAIGEREKRLKQYLTSKYLKQFYVEDLDLSSYPKIDLQKKVLSKAKIKYTLSIPGKKESFLLNKQRLGSCLDAYDKVYNFIKKDFDKKKILSDNHLFFMSLSGMIGTLDDPNTRMIPPKALKEMTMEVEGEFGGLGIVISEIEGWITVITPMDGTPAMKAGILEGDKIIKINGKSTRNMGLLKAVRLMRGKPGTKITITIQRGALQKDITLTRARIKLKYVKGTMVAPEMGVIRITSFMGKVLPKQFKEAFQRLQKKGMKALILDLRNNPGGLLDNAQKIASFFLKPGQVVVSTRGRNPLYNEVLKVDPKFVSKKQIPVVVLINKGSASASEIVSGALQDYKRAILIGETSYGKGSVQRVFPIQDFQTAFAITIAKYYLPKGRCIHKIGIKPDYVIIHSLLTKLKIRARSIYSHKKEKINDLHMKKAISLLRKQLHPHMVGTSRKKVSQK